MPISIKCCSRGRTAYHALLSGAGSPRPGADARRRRRFGVPDAEREVDRLVDVPEVLQYHEAAAVPPGFRSSFRDWAAKMTDHPREVIEAALVHVVQNKVEAAYARSVGPVRAPPAADGRLVGVPRPTASDGSPATPPVNHGLTGRAVALRDRVSLVSVSFPRRKTLANEPAAQPRRTPPEARRLTVEPQDEAPAVGPS